LPELVGITFRAVNFMSLSAPSLTPVIKVILLNFSWYSSSSSSYSSSSFCFFCSSRS
jgi:hypothetical protein